MILFLTEIRTLSIRIWDKCSAVRTKYPQPSWMIRHVGRSSRAENKINRSCLIKCCSIVMMNINKMCRMEHWTILEMTNKWTKIILPQVKEAQDFWKMNHKIQWCCELSYQNMWYAFQKWHSFQIMIFRTNF